MKADLSYPKSNRLTHKLEFKALFDHGKKANQRYVLALFQANNALNARLGIIVGKRVARRAVVRNQIKRVIRESFRVNQDKLSGLDILVIVRPTCSSLEKNQLRRGVEELWQRLLTQYQNVSP